MDFIHVLSTYLEVEHALIVLSLAFIIAFVWILKKKSELNSELGRLIRDASAILSGVQTIDLETYERLSERMKKSEMLAHAWSEFDETVIKDDSEEVVQIYNTKSFSEFIPKHDFLEHNFNLSLFRKIPSLITSIGLFFTFLFIVFGLMHLIPQESGKIDGVPALITGLSAKFQSSVLAIFLSIVFTVVEDRFIRSVEHTYQRLIDLLDSNFQRKTGEDYLRSLDQNMKELNQSMKRFSTDLAGVIKEGLQEGMRPSTDRLLVAIENLEKQKSENIADTLTKLLGEFKSSLNQSAGSEFEALASSVSKLAQIMNESAEQSTTMATRMDGLVRALDNQIQKQEQNSDASLAKLQQGFTHLLTMIERNTEVQNETLNRLLTDVVTKTSQATNGLISNVESLSSKNANIVSGFTDLNENISKSVEKYQEAVQSTKGLIQATSDLAASLGTNFGQLASLQSKMDQTFHQFMEQTTVVQSIQKENADSIQKYQSVFSEVEGGLETILRQIADNLQRYNDLTKSGLETYLRQYDDSLSTSTTKLSSTVKDLDEVLESLGDHMEIIRNSVKLPVVQE